MVILVTPLVILIFPEFILLRCCFSSSDRAIEEEDKVYKKYEVNS